MRCAPGGLSVFLCVSAILAGCADTPSANQPPVAAFTVIPQGSAGAFVLDATGSQDPEGEALTYAWDFATGTATGKTVQIAVPTTGNATLPVVLVVRDASGGFGTRLDPQAIKLGSGSNQIPSITLVDASRWVVSDSTIVLDASPSRDPDGDPLAFEWIWGPFIDFDPTLTDHGDPLGSQNLDAQTFNSGALGPGDAFSQTFSKPGTYNYVCHPHPWMTGRIVVDPALPAGGSAQVSIEGYAYRNETVRIGPDGQVTWTNGDADRHTASAMDYTPGLLDGGTGPVFTQTLSAGKHVVRVIATDDKGGRFSASYGLLASSDAPPPSRTTRAAADPQRPETLARPAVGSQPAQSPRTPLIHLNYTADLNGTLIWQDPSGALFDGFVEIVNVSRNETGVDVPCSGSKTPDKAEYRFSCRHTPPGLDQKYRARVVANKGVLDWRLSLTSTEYHGAGFGDYNAARCHLHPPSPPHCF